MGIKGMKRIKQRIKKDYRGDNKREKNLKGKKSCKTQI